MRTLFALVLAAVVGATALADPPDDTLRHYLGKSHYALVGQVVSIPTKVDRVSDDGGRLIKKGQVVYTCRVKVLEHFHCPDGPAPREITVCVVRWADEKDELPAALKKGETCIFFLK